jgi:type IV pilus assembly protein PilY1
MKTKNNNNSKKSTLLVMLTIASCINQAYSAPLALSQAPLFLSTTTIPNIMILYGNSNSMDTQADGQAAGSANADSKSEITRQAVKELISNYQNRVNMGLMAYAQNNITLRDMSNSPYDVSYNPLHYDPTWNGDRASATKKKFRTPNPTDAGKFIYYNVALPSYGGVQSDKTKNNFFCFTSNTRSKAFSNGEVIVNNDISNANSGPWLPYSCYFRKTNTRNAGPTNTSTPGDTTNATTAGYSSSVSTNTRFMPTDSDLAQGITNFGNQLAQSYVSPAWFSNSSPGYGYVHVPVGLLNAAQITKLNTKLGTAQFNTTNTQTNASYPLVNAGLTPLAGAVNTANTYFSGKLSNTSQGGTFPLPPNSCGKSYLLMLTDGLPSVLADGKISYNTKTLLDDLTLSVKNLKEQDDVNSYVVGFALPYGVSISQLNSIAAAGGTNLPFYADDPETLSAALNNVFTDIISRTSAASSVALNSGYVSNGDKVYQARFSSADWSGDVLSIPLDNSGALPADIVTAATWKAATSMKTQTASNRVIITYKPSLNRGIAFRWPSNVTSPTISELDVSQTSSLNLSPTMNNNDNLGSSRLNYLRGDRTNESGLFRKRSGLLGDIVNSSPVLVKAPQSNYLTSDYSAFRNTYTNRTPIIYVGANDGMLHGFNAETGKEVLGYVPNAVFSNLSQLTSTTYSHRYYVDGTPKVGDVQFIDNSWRTMLVSGMGHGAKGIFALDVTNPTSFTEANARNIARFEYTSENNADVGNIQSAPSVIKMNNGKWAAVFGNGWNNSGSGKASLMIVDIETGQLIKQLTTNAGNTTTPNGLSNPTVVDVDGNGTADYAYAGDIYGNMWKFNLTNASSDNWNVAFNNAPLFVTGTAKSITSQPEVSLSPNGGYMVMFGTGQYLQNADLGSTSQQTLYGIWDNNAVVTAAQLKQQTINQVNSNFRNVTTGLVNYPTQKGWYINLPSLGERSVTDSLLSGGNVFFSTLTPSNITCSYGGTSWLMSVNYLHGNQPESPIFDSNADKEINTNDTIYAGTSLVGISSAPTILKGLGNANRPLQELFFNLSSGNVTGVYTSASRYSSRRTSWRSVNQK